MLVGQATAVGLERGPVDGWNKFSCCSAIVPSTPIVTALPLPCRVSSGTAPTTHGGAECSRRFT